MKNMKQLQEKRGQLVKDANALLETARTETRALTPEENEKLDGIQTEAEGLNKTIDAEVRQMSLEGQKQVNLSRQEERDISGFSIGKVIRSLDSGKNGADLDGIEREMMTEGENELRSSGKPLRGIALPQVLCENRDLTAGTANQGGELIATEKMGLAGGFYNASVLAQGGAMVLRGLQGNVDLPRYTKASDPAAKAENANSDELSPTFASLSLTPQRLPAHIDISDQLVMQSDTVLMPFLNREISQQMLDVQEVAFLHGDGTNQPTGIENTSGIGSVVGGANGAAPDWADVVNLESAVANANAASGKLAYITNSTVRGFFKQTPKVASTDSIMIMDSRDQGRLNDYEAKITNAVSSALTKGSGTDLSAIFFGNLADFVIGYWGGIMLEVVRDKSSAIAGLRTLVANTYYDGGVLRPGSFAAMLDADA